ncbi:YceI family protein, partial [Escherichia sp. R-CC3]
MFIAFGVISIDAGGVNCHIHFIGTFKDFDGTFTFDEKNPAADKVNVTINTTSVDTNHAERDK